MADVRVELKEATKAERGTESAEAALSRTGTTEALRQRAKAARRAKRASARGARRKGARSKKESGRATSGTQRREVKQEATEADATEMLRETARRLVGKSHEGIGEVMLEQALDGKMYGAKLLAELAEKKPRKEPVKKPRRLNWARQWAAELEWKAPEETAVGSCGSREADKL